jgi:hypothetical protein
VSAPVIRQATADDLIAYYGEAPQHSMKAYVVILDGKPIGIAGVSYQVREEAGRVKLFSEMKPEMRRYKKTMLKGAREMLKAFAVPGMVAVANPEEGNSRKLLASLGFVPGVVTPDGQVFVYAGLR